jgi:hypothetical protein
METEHYVDAGFLALYQSLSSKPAERNQFITQVLKKIEIIKYNYHEIGVVA